LYRLANFLCPAGNSFVFEVLKDLSLRKSVGLFLETGYQWVSKNEQALKVLSMRALMRDCVTAGTPFSLS